MSHSHDHTPATSCIAANLDRPPFSLPLHLAALFSLLLISALGCFSTLLLSLYPHHLHLPPALLFALRHLGTGIILATALIHMLPAALAAFNDPCLAESQEIYSAWGPLVILLSMLFMQLIEFVAIEVARRRERKTSAKQQERRLSVAAGWTRNVHSHARCGSDASEGGNGTPDAFLGQDQQEHACNDRPMLLEDGEGDCTVGENLGIPVHHHTGHHCHADPGILMLDANTTTRQRIATYVLEFGIALHSILIGLALGVESEAFIALWIAIAFHQFFEGLALGQRIAQVTSKHQLWRGYVMAFVYALTTPLGIGIGIAVHQSYSASDPGVLIVTGVLDAIATGVLLYTALIHLMGADMLQSDEYGGLRGRWKVLGFASLWFGAMIMAVIGKWA